MTLYEELQARGLVAQTTDADKVAEMINNGKATFYIGFDPTADSPARRSLHGPVPDAPDAEVWQPTHRPAWRRYRHDR